jgi:hypothetical protein
MYEVFSTKPGAADAKGWRWVLTREGESLTRGQAARLVQAVKARDAALKAVVYCYGVWKYTV